MNTASEGRTPSRTGQKALLLVTWLVRLGIGGIFTYAGAMKWGDPAAFAIEIDHYELMPKLAPYLAVTLPATEVLLGLSVVALPSLWRRAAALGCGALMLVFTFGAAYAMARGLNIDCGCFGSGSGPITWLTLVRDGALLMACAWLVVEPQGRASRATGYSS